MITLGLHADSMKLRFSLIFLQFSAILAISCTPASSQPANAPRPSWGWPLEPHRIIRKFDPPAQNWLPGHRGVDLAGTSGEVVHSVGNGEVIFAGEIAGRGVIVVKHGTIRTTYEPVTASVTVGTHVRTGDEIGNLQPGESHCVAQATVICLHWGLIQGQTYLNPLLLVKKQVRLLPITQKD